jgi:hypothetical protein
VNERQTLEARERALQAELDRRRSTSQRQADYVLRNDRRGSDEDQAPVEPEKSDDYVRERAEERRALSTSEQQARLVARRSGRGWGAED